MVSGIYVAKGIWRRNRPPLTPLPTRGTMTTYHRTTIDGVEVFHREAGPANAGTIVLLHGFPSSSHMFRDLIPKLADRFHVIAPDYIGFGYSAHPTTQQCRYTFDNLAAKVEGRSTGIAAVDGCVDLDEVVVGTATG